jgi:glycosyltransferase involved in cell wall biosynthesis
VGPRVSLLLPNYNNARILPLVLDRLAEHTTYPDVEIVVVDDGSTDGSREVLRRWRDSRAFRGDVQLHEKPHSGAVDALNAALHAATGEVCVQLDSDASVETPRWLERMLALLTLDERVGVVTAKVVMEGGVLHACGIDVMHPHGLHDRPTTVLEPVGRRRWHHRVQRVREGAGGRVEQEVAEVDAGIGCCMMFRREDALAAGGYDTGYAPVWFDDVDLCLGIRSLGRKVFYLPEVRVVHRLISRTAPVGLGRYRPSHVARALLHQTAMQIPQAARTRFDVDLALHYTATQRARLDHHYAYWREKWGWDLCNPDVDAIAERWGGTELNWAREPDLRAAGEEVVRAFRALRARPEQAVA